MDDGGRDGLAVEHIRALRAGNHGSHGDALVVPEEILHKKGLARLTLADQDDDLVVFDFRHVELLQSEVQTTWGRGTGSC